jgi:hypothetical protein
MNSQEINRILRNICGETFIGVYAKDQLPPITARPALLIANTDPAHQPGTHWIAMYFSTDGTGELFDPLALPIDTNFKNFMDKYCRHWITNKHQIQSVVSRFCGHHCIVYCMFRYKHFDLNAICAMYMKDYGYNDVIAHELVCRQIKR